MPYQDTLWHDDDLAGIDPHQFDEIRPKSPCGDVADDRLRPSDLGATS